MKASIIIRSKNEARYISEVLERVVAQHYPKPFEVLLLDSGSRDDTVKIASGFPVTLYPMRPEEFTFGRASNRGAQLAKGDVVVYLSAHCTPTDQEWLTRLLQPLEDDPGVAATYGRQDARKGVNPFEEMELEWIFPADPARGPLAIFSAANCAIRREIARRFPFDEASPGAEDYIWRKRLPAEYHVVYVPGSSVYHSHPLSVRFWADRFRRHGQRVPFLFYAYGMEYPGCPSHSPLSSYLRYACHTALQAYRYCRDNGYLFHLLLIPFFEALRVFSFWRGLREGRAAYRHFGRSGSLNGRAQVAAPRGGDGL